LNVLNKYFSISSVGILDAFNVWKELNSILFVQLEKLFLQ
jgi:hypothetical protein